MQNSISIPTIHSTFISYLAKDELKNEDQCSSLEKNHDVERIVNNAKQHETFILLKNKVIKLIHFISERLNDIFSFLFKSKTESADFKKTAVIYCELLTPEEKKATYEYNLDEICKLLRQHAERQVDGNFRVPAYYDKEHITNNIYNVGLDFNKIHMKATGNYFRGRITELTVIDNVLFKKIEENIKNEKYENAVNDFLEKVLTENNNKEFVKLLKTSAYCYQQASDNNTNKYNETVMQRIFSRVLFNKIDYETLYDVNIQDNRYISDDKDKIENMNEKFFKFIHELFFQCNNKLHK